MKKMLSMILAFTMICSCFAMPSAASATDITEAERKAILAEKDYTYIDITPNIDAFASVSVIRDYANFSNAVVDADPFNKQYTATNSEGEEYTYRNRIPSKTHGGESITGEEDYYKKGMGNFNLDAERMSPMIFVTESLTMTAEELKNVAVKHYDTGSKITADIVAGNPETYVTKTVSFKKEEYNFLPDVVKTEEDGDSYYAYLKANKEDVQFKIGPINDEKYVKNAFDFIKAESSARKFVLPEGTKGEKLAVAVATAEINNGSGYGDKNGGEALNLDKADAALIPFEVVYKSGAKETNYVVVTNMTQTAVTTIDDLVGVAIYSGDKYDAEGAEINYKNEELYHTSKNATSPLTRLSGTEYTLDDIQFPSNIYAAEMNVAISLRARQDTENNNYGNKATVGIFDLKDEEVSTINIINDQTPGDNTDIEGVIGLNNGSDTYPRALIPVTFKNSENAEEDKVYFLYVARVSAGPAILGATVMGGESIQDKIDALNEVLSALDSETLTLEQIEDYRAQIEAIKASNEYVLDTDFDTTALDEAEKKYQDQRPLYAPVEMGLLTDYFATKAERTSTEWLNQESYLAYLGYYKANAIEQPATNRTEKSHGGVISIDATAASINGISELKNGRYVLTVGDVPYTIGKTTEGVVDANAFAPGEMISKIEGNLVLPNIDEKYTLNLSKDGTYYTVYSGKFPVEKASSKINIVTTSLENQGTATKYCLYTVDAKVYLDNGETVDYTLLTGEGVKKNTISINDAILFVPKASAETYNSYASINGAVGGDVKTLANMTDVKLADIKLPSAPSVAGPSVSKGYLLGLEGNTTLAATNFYYQNLILPEKQQIIDIDRTDTTYAYASSFEITAPKGTKITAVEFIHDAGGSFSKDESGYANTIGGYIETANATNSAVLVPATVEGLEDYDVYVRAKRNCHHSAVLGMTVETTVHEVKTTLETLMEKAETLADIDAIEDMKEYIDEKNLLTTDISETARAKYNALAENIDVVAEVESMKVDDKAVVNVNVTNHTRLAGKKYMVVVAFYDGNNRLIEAVPQKFSTTAARDINETVTVDKVPENTASTQVYVWKDFLSIISLID